MRNRRHAAGARSPSGIPGRLHARRHARRSSAGQALLIAVLVLFAVATLAALFAGIIGSQLTQVARRSDMVALRNIAEAGLRLANEQLTYSPEGADWRPSGDPYTCGDGQVRIDVTYGPTPEELQSRFLRIVSTAVFPDNPFLRHTILALKPVLLTDYARFITDRHETNRAAHLGVTGLEMGGTTRQDYVSYIEGPIRSNTDLIWYGQSRVSLHTTFDTTVDWRDLRILRDDRIEIAGSMRPAHNSSPLDALTLVVDGFARAGNLFQPSTLEEQYDYSNGFPQVWEGEIVPNSRALLADLDDLWTMTDLVPGAALSVPRVRPPEIDAIHPDKETNRYFLLTRDSGFWVPDVATGFYYNTGESGWGWVNYGGVYIDNLGDIQYDHDLEKLRLNLTRSVGAHAGVGDERDPAVAGRPPTGPADWWDETARYYAPPGVEIILHGDDACPWYEIIRHDLRGPAGAEYYWQDPDGVGISAVDPNPDIPDELVYQYDPPPGACTPTGGPRPIGIYDGNRAVFPFAPNGVIYAEGNVRIRGIMPPVRDNQGRVGTAIPMDQAPVGYFGDWNSMTGRSRRFDLQVVSGGTIYIDSDLLSPATAQLGGLLPDNILTDQLYGSRIALLARDYVCVNTTALNPRPVDLFSRVADAESPGGYAFYNDAQPIFPPGTTRNYWLFQGPEGDTDYKEEGHVVSTVPGGIRLQYRSTRLTQASLWGQLADLRLIFGHSGWYSQGGTGDTEEPPAPVTGDNQAGVIASFEIANEYGTYTWPWEWDTDTYTFRRNGVADPSVADESDHWHIDGDELELLPNEYQFVQVYQSGFSSPYLSGDDGILFYAEVEPIERWEEGEPKGWEVPPSDLGYVLGPIAVAPPRGVDPLPVEIEALIYAQNGSWFVIPGRWFNEDPDEFGQDPTAQLYPGYHEPLNISIRVYGAISENMPADLGSAADWTSKWCGPIGEGAEGFLTYTFDPLLRQPRWETEDRVGYLRFPNFPITSDLVIWGERVSGPAGM